MRDTNPSDDTPLEGRILRRSNIKIFKYLLIAVALLVHANRSADGDSSKPLAVTSFTHNQNTIERLGLYESTITLNKSWEDPFDSIHHVEVNAYFRLTNGDVKKISGFWHEGFTRSLHDKIEYLQSSNEKGWKFRFSPRTTGSFQYYIEIVDRSDNDKTVRYPASGSLSFTSVPSTRTGFLAVSKTDGRYLDFEDGSLFLGLGHNVLGWEWKGHNNSGGTFDYDRWLSRMAASRANMAQLDFCEGDQIEWTASSDELSYSPSWQGIGKYSQQACWRMDHIISKAEELGIFFRLCFSHWEDFDEEVKSFPDWGWGRNPYNQANGGPVATVTDFFTDSAAKDFYKKYLRYIVARWGYSKNILCYEFWNEVDSNRMIWGPGNNYQSNRQNVLQWHREMSDYLKGLDPDHLVTTSFANNLNQDSIWKLPNIDLTTIHRYPLFNDKADGGFEKFEVENCLAYLIHKRTKSDTKPILVGEYTVSPLGVAHMHTDPSGIAFHNQLWVSILQGSLGTAMHWQWGYYIDDFDLYHHYQALAVFLEGEDLRNTNAYETKGDIVNGYGLKSHNKVYAWLHDIKYTFIDRDSPHSLIAGQTHELADMENGKYALQFYDTDSGIIVTQQTLECTNGRLSIRIPDFNKDIALKAKKL